MKMFREKDEIDVCGGTVRSGALLPLWALGSKAPELAGIQEDTPVLTCSISASLAALIVSCDEGGHLSFGSFMTREPDFIRLRYRDAEIFWLADRSDPEIWESIYRWNRAGRVPIRLTVTGEAQEKFLVATVDMPSDTSPFDATYRYGGGEEPSAHMWTCLIALAENGNWQYDEEDGEIYDIDDVPLQYSLFRVLMTRRWLEYVNHQISLADADPSAD